MARAGRAFCLCVRTPRPGCRPFGFLVFQRCVSMGAQFGGGRVRVSACWVVSFQGEHELAGAGDAERDRLPAGFLDASAARLTCATAHAAACRFIPSPSAHPPRSGASAAGQGGAPYWTNDLDPRRLVCSALPGRWRRGEPAANLSHTATPPVPSILEPEGPRRRQKVWPSCQLGDLCYPATMWLDLAALGVFSDCNPMACAVPVKSPQFEPLA